MPSSFQYKMKNSSYRELARLGEQIRSSDNFQRPGDDKLLVKTPVTDSGQAVKHQSPINAPDVQTLIKDPEYMELLSRYSAKFEDFGKVIVDQANVSAGKGGYYSQMQTSMARIDKFGHRIMSSAQELCGLTFFTRPKLNLTSNQLKQDPFLVMLNTLNPNSMAFMIRMLLDTKLARADSTEYPIRESPFIDNRSPWLIPLMNNLTDISGFPDPTMDIYTTEGGFFNEDLSFASGSDRGRRTFEVQATFSDVNYGVVLSLLQYYYEWIAIMNQGIVSPYLEDMENRVLNYTISIYRFLFDPTRRYITRWCKCTGCFPRAIPVGGVFNISEGEVFVSSAAKFSVPFTCNVFEYNKPSALTDFNKLTEKYCPDIRSDKYVTSTDEAASNYIGFPYIVSTKRGMRMIWRYNVKENPYIQNELLEGYVDNLQKDSDKLYDKEFRAMNANRDVEVVQNSPYADGDVYVIPS